MFSIIISEKGGAERRQLFEQTEVSIGRVQGNDLVLPKGNVSKRHCRLEQADGRFTVTDQNSTNGTYLNRRRITQSTVVRQGDRIYIGDFILRVEEGAVEGAIPSGAPPPPVGAHLSPSVPPEGGGVPSSTLEGHHPAPPNLTQASAPGHSVPPPLPVPVSEPVAPAHPAPVAAPAPVLAQPSRTTTDERPLMNNTGRDLHNGVGNAVRFVVERVAAQMSPAELGSAAGRQRVEALVEAVMRELEGDPAVAGADAATALQQYARAELLDIGPLAELLEDPSVIEIAVSGSGYVSVTRGTRAPEPTVRFSSSASVTRCVERLCAREGVPLKATERMARRHLATSGFDLDIVRGEVSPAGPIVRLARAYAIPTGLEDLVRMGTMSRSLATFVEQCVVARANILVVGPRRSGATEVLSALASAVGDERLLVLTDEEDIAGIGDTATNLKLARGVEPQALLSNLAKLPGHRIAIDGMLEPARAMAAIRVGAEGAEGVIGRLGSRNIERGLAQICAQLAVAHPGLSAETFADGLVATFDLVLEVARLADGRSRVVRVAELGRGESLPVVAYDVFTFTVERIATGGAVEGSFTPTGRQPQFAGELRLRGARFDANIFGRAARPPYPS